MDYLKDCNNLDNFKHSMYLKEKYNRIAEECSVSAAELWRIYENLDWCPECGGLKHIEHPLCYDCYKSRKTIRQNKKTVIKLYYNQPEK